ncbi:hydrocephalus-inducing protein-like [Haemorhous mexicanus]|uniref:hydrocephalus-inducing protein-like n=1 Tax=Haemorhous mexicanus TaxID=30427 RepID=UPI0028BE58E7|nr:hydrocephalus-inducing protein-like [Haemorhous mexicanus]
MISDTYGKCREPGFPPGRAFLVQEQPGAGAEAPAISSAAAVARHVPGPGADSSPSGRAPRGQQGWKERGPRPARRHRPRPGPDNRVLRLPGNRGRGHSGCDGAAASVAAERAPGWLFAAWAPATAALSDSLGDFFTEIVSASEPWTRRALVSASEESSISFEGLLFFPIPWLVKVSMESCPYFQLACPRDVYHVVPAGASAPVRIRFSPAENKDYCYQLVCMTARERIVVPIRAIGARAVLDFPAQLDFSKCAVQGSTQKTLLVRNVGTRAARYQLSTQSPFSVVPATGALGAGDTVQVTVGFHPRASGDHWGSLAEGEIGPNCSAEIKVTFKPLEALEYGSVAYCSISGRESRLPLQLRGEGQGPLVELSSQTLDLGNVFVNTPHVYEVKLMNQGALDAPFTCIPSATKVGSCFKFAPEEGIIAAGGSQTVQISFSATVLGSFEEEFQLRVAGSPMPAILTIKGSVSALSLHFDLPELDFGDISFGFPYTQRCRLTNSSAVPLTFQLRMSDDGTQPAVDSVDQIRRHSDPAWRKGIHFYVEPREFTMNPSRGTILPQGHQDIEVTLCSNTVMEFRRRMLVDLEGIGKGVTKLFITARCLVPELQVSPYVLQYDECHLKVPYEKKLVIRNPSHLPGCYGLIPQPQSTAEIPVVVEVQALGEHRTNVLIGVFGDERNPLDPKWWPCSQEWCDTDTEQLQHPEFY